jgi:DNA-binding NarL/FixJ family response regulator
MTNPIRILLVDDSPYFLEAAREFLNLHESLTVVDTATEEQDAIAKSLATRPDVILLDINLGYLSGLELIPIFRQNLPQVKIVALSMMDPGSYRAAALQAGADEFVQKSRMHHELIPAVHALYRETDGA